MKLKNIFKKEVLRTSGTKNNNVQNLDKDQLSKVIGGSEETSGRNLGMPLASGPSGTTAK